MWIRKLFKIGKVVAVSFPKEIVEKYNLSEKDYVVITQKGEKELDFEIVGVDDVIKIKQK